MELILNMYYIMTKISYTNMRRNLEMIYCDKISLPQPYINILKYLFMNFTHNGMNM